MAKQHSLIVLAEDIEIAKDVNIIMPGILKDIHWLECCHEKKSFRAVLGYETPYILIYLLPSIKNLKVYLDSLNLGKRRFSCIITENSEYTEGLLLLNIRAITLPLTNIKIRGEIFQHPVLKDIIIEQIVIEKVIDPIAEIVEEIIVVSVARLKIFEFETGDALFDLNMIFRFEIQNRKLYLIPVKGEKKCLKGTIGEWAVKLKAMDFEFANRSTLVNVQHVTGKSKNKCALIIDGKNIHLEDQFKEEFTISWQKLYGF